MLTQPTTRVEPASATDLPALVSLIGELFAIEKDFNPDPRRQECGLRALLNMRETAAIYVARGPTGDVVGMVTAQLVISTSEGAPSAWVEDLVVRAEYRRTGVARELTRQILDWARSRGATRAQLVYDLDNDAAIRFYEHTGWSRTHLGVRRQVL
ncbi:MAG: N-acetyltransferase family protein [Phycisphaerae bacterium]|nr:GNAT family N-acetyltransferase [Tepidisphaeraceae bacterium]